MKDITVFVNEGLYHRKTEKYALVMLARPISLTWSKPFDSVVSKFYEKWPIMLQLIIISHSEIMHFQYLYSAAPRGGGLFIRFPIGQFEFILEFNFFLGFQKSKYLSLRLTTVGISWHGEWQKMRFS